MSMEDVITATAQGLDNKSAKLSCLQSLSDG